MDCYLFNQRVCIIADVSDLGAIITRQIQFKWFKGLGLKLTLLWVNLMEINHSILQRNTPCRRCAYQGDWGLLEPSSVFSSSSLMSQSQSAAAAAAAAAAPSAGKW